MIRTNTYETKVTNKPFVAEGTLLLANDLNDYDFHVYNKQAVSSKSITKYLNRIYKSESPFIRLHIENMNNGEVINIVGELIKALDSDGLYDWHIDEIGNNFELGKQLYEWGENDVEVKIEQVTEAECGYEQTRYKVM